MTDRKLIREEIKRAFEMQSKLQDEAGRTRDGLRSRLIADHLRTQDVSGSDRVRIIIEARHSRDELRDIEEHEHADRIDRLLSLVEDVVDRPTPRWSSGKDPE